MQIYFLGAIDIRNDAKVVEVALTFARSFIRRQVFSEANQGQYGQVITADDLAKGEKTEDLPEQKPADSEEQAVQDVHLQPRNKDGLLWPYSERGVTEYGHHSPLHWTLPRKSSRRRGQV